MRITSQSWVLRLLVILPAVCLAFLGCAKKEEEEEEDPFLGVWKTSCELYFADDQIVDTDFCSEEDNIAGTQATAEANVAECNEKYATFSFKDTVTFRSSGDAVNIVNDKVLTGTAEASYNQLVYTRTTYSDEDCKEKVATLSRAFHYQPDASTLLAKDNPDDELGTRFPDLAKTVNFQLTQAALTYETDEDDNLENNQSVREVCENDAWTEGDTVDITNKDNCLFNDNMLMDTLGIDVGANLSVMTTQNGNTNASSYYPFSIYSSTWDDDEVVYSSFISGEELYTIYNINSDAAVKKLKLGNFFDVRPFGMDSFCEDQGICEGDDDDEEHVSTSVNADGDNDNHRQYTYGLTFSFDETATDAL